MNVNNETMRVAILCGNQLVAFTDDVAAVRVAAGLIATAPRHDEPPVLAPITEGRRQACRLVAMGAA